jgi:hypothetical protein
MDLSTIKKRLENGSIQSLEEFQRDLRLMFTNVILYYHADAVRHAELSEMQDECFKLLEVSFFYVRCMQINCIIDSLIELSRALIQTCSKILNNNN